MERGIVRVRVGLSYDPLRLSPSSLICIKQLRFDSIERTPQKQPNKPNQEQNPKPLINQKEIPSHNTKTLSISVGHLNRFKIALGTPYPYHHPHLLSLVGHLNNSSLGNHQNPGNLVGHLSICICFR